MGEFDGGIDGGRGAREREEDALNKELLKEKGARELSKFGLVHVVVTKEAEEDVSGWREWESCGKGGSAQKADEERVDEEEIEDSGGDRTRGEDEWLSMLFCFPLLSRPAPTLPSETLPLPEELSPTLP